MKRGIALMESDEPAAIVEALTYFDRALALRLDLPLDEFPRLRYGLAACWLNRGDALVRLGDPARLPAAVHAYDEGIAAMRDLDLFADPLYPRRLVIAHQNRGIARLAQGPDGLNDAVRSLAEAIAILDGEPAAAMPDREHLRAAAWMNLANVHAADPSHASDTAAHDAARRALTMVAELEATDPAAAEVGLKARHVLCRIVAVRLTSSGAPAPGAIDAIGAPDDLTMPDDVHEATDAVDEGLALVRQWEQRGVPHFRLLACDLFRFGARVYARYQPQFLEEFVLENVDAAQSSREFVLSEELQAAAHEALELLNRPSST